MFFDVWPGTGHNDELIHPGSCFLVVAFLLLLSREIRFDEFDIEGDRVGGRSTVPMVIDKGGLKKLHFGLSSVALLLLFLILSFAGKFHPLTNLGLGLITSSGAAWLMLVAYRSRSKETFYKITRLVMLFIPVSILVGF
jgi:4-hydroxybenzoate polyprenyltransferase